MKELIVYSVIVTYEDYSDDLDEIYPTRESAIRRAKKLLSQSRIIEVRINQDVVTEEYGRRWRSTAYRETKQALG